MDAESRGGVGKMVRMPFECCLDVQLFEFVDGFVKHHAAIDQLGYQRFHSIAKLHTKEMNGR